MKIGQTSLIVFLSRFLGAALGFVGTVFFARELGAGPLGFYAMVTAIVAWLVLFGQIGLTNAVIKRLSEGEDEGAYMVAGAISVAILALALSVGVLVFRDHIEAYTSGIEVHLPVSVVWFIIAFLLLDLSYSIIHAHLKGNHLVHISGAMIPVKTGLRTLLQIGLVLAGLGLLGLFLGYVMGVVIVGLLSMAFISFSPQMPTRQHFKSLFDYAKFAWLGGLESRAYNDVDIVILGALVPSALVGTYSVAWSLATFLSLFGNAISQSMFPEISNVSAQNSLKAATGYIEDSLTFAGLIAFPGFVGGTLLSDRILQIYGGEFTRGTEVLWILLLSVVLYNFFQQLLTALNGIDRPDQAFRANAVFIFFNIGLNILFIIEFGWVGAAIASVLSVGLGVCIAFWMVRTQIPISIPIDAIGKQIIASLGMGAVVIGVESTITAANILQHNFLLVATLVALGGLVYGTILLAISSQFRAAIIRNMPVEGSILSNS